MLRVLSFNAVWVVIRFCTAFIAVKAMALLIGPAGIALMGNFRSFLTTLQSVSTLGIREGVVKFISEKKDDEAALKKVFSTAFLVVLVASLLLGIAVFLSSELLDDYLFPNASYVSVFKTTAFLVPLSAVHIFLLAVLNGFHRYKKVIGITIILSVLGLGIMLVLMWFFGIEGALLAAVIGESVILIVTLSVAGKPIFRLFAVSHYSKYYFKGFLQYSVMALVTAVVLPLTFILIRNTIIHQLSVDEAGYWEALNRISGIYMVFVTSGLTLYYFPRLSELTTDWAFKGEVLNYYKTLVPLFLIALTGIYFLRDWIILLVLSADFTGIGDFMIWQLAGDLLKVMSLAFGYQILAKAMIGKYIFIELLFGVLFYVLSVYFMGISGLSGVVQAYFVANLINFTVMLFLFRKTLF